MRSSGSSLSSSTIAPGDRAVDAARTLRPAGHEDRAETVADRPRGRSREPRRGSGCRCGRRAHGAGERAVSAKDAATTRARRASSRVARPGTAFCSSSTTGIRCASAADDHRDRHVAADADDDVGAHPAEQAPGGDGGPRQLRRRARDAARAARRRRRSRRASRDEGPAATTSRSATPSRRPTTATSSSGRASRSASATASAGVR